MALMPCHCLFQFYTRLMNVDERREAFGRYIDPHYWNQLPYEGRMAIFDNAGTPSRYLDCQLYQRSADLAIGVPFNIASYALLTHMMAAQANMVPGNFVWTGGDCHIYSNHVDHVKTQLGRKPFPLPQLKLLRKPDSIFDYRFEDIQLVDYKCHPAIKLQVAV